MHGATEFNDFSALTFDVADDEVIRVENSALRPERGTVETRHGGGRMSCCDATNTSPLETLPAGLSSLPRQLRGFPDVRRDLLRALRDGGSARRTGVPRATISG